MSETPLLDAWMGMRASIGATARVRQKHFVPLYETIWELACSERRELPVNDATREEVGQMCALALLERTEITELPSEGVVRAYLRTWVRNRLIDRVRSQRRETSLPETPIAAPEVEPQLDTAPLLAIFDELPTRVIEPLYATRPKRREGALASYAEMLNLALGHTTVEELVGECATVKERNKVRNALYNRHQRLRDAMLRHIEEATEHGVLSRVQADRFATVVDALRRRQDQRRDQS
jgi:DNA-directed RNA polymerase specialized sigma24 family protein